MQSRSGSAPRETLSLSISNRGSLQQPDARCDSGPCPDKEVIMKMRIIPNYPRGIEAVKWKRNGSWCWSVYYTQPDTVGAKEQLLGTIRQAADGIYVIPSCEHPSLKSLSQSVWWLYGLTVGVNPPPSE